MVGEVTMRPYVASAILAGAVVLAPVVAGYAPASSKAPFTVTNDPVKETVVDTMLQRTCTGTVTPIWWAGMPHYRVQFIFYRKPDATKWVKVYHEGIGPEDYPVIELGVSGQWTGLGPPQKNGGKKLSHYAIWPDGDNRLTGSTVEPYGTINLTCESEPSGRIGW
jgi:hypothetical protein